MMVVWGVSITFVLAQFILAWSQQPFSATASQTKRLNRAKVTVVIPCYNEEATILDRVLYSISLQTRLPQKIIVVDDGSKVDYTEVSEYWARKFPVLGVEFLWLVHLQNAGKKHAQVTAFNADPRADFYVTIDSDSALESRGLEEGMKPFANKRIVSVAGLETAYNYSKNILTRMMSARVLAFQLLAMSAQSVAAGNVIINPGAFSIYRGWVIRKIIPAYIGETFFGTPVTLGDDTALTFFALMHGKAVHQPTAVAMNMYPEKISHHLRQWIRWMRASTIRFFWRAKYLRKNSYAWWFVVWQAWAFITSCAVSIAIPLAWPATKNLAIAAGIALIIWPMVVAMRLITVKRSDQTWKAKLGGVLLLPVAALWYLLVQRNLRFYGMATCHKQGWVTRQEVEVSIQEAS